MSDLQYYDKDLVDDAVSLMTGTNGWNDYEDAIDPSKLPEIMRDIERRILPVARFEILDIKQRIAQHVSGEDFKDSRAFFNPGTSALIADAEHLNFLRHLHHEAQRAVTLWKARNDESD